MYEKGSLRTLAWIGEELAEELWIVYVVRGRRLQRGVESLSTTDNKMLSLGNYYRTGLDAWKPRSCLLLGKLGSKT